MEHQANWPIRVGGIYVPDYPNRGSWVGSRVTAIDGDTVYVVLRTEHRPGDIEEHGPRSYDIDQFRRCYLPEDVSPMPALIEALTAMRSFMWSEGYADQNEAMAKADAALAKVTASEPVPEELAA